ncbi:hypothetical protein Q7A53_00105 [Halobacillus rhizosphaerae]|uniref:hypothetical protein n=1 Tax=Halobacillus rhizosphaerae TaxID=3064889 RepID=UPI00398B30B3
MLRQLILLLILSVFLGGCSIFPSEKEIVQHTRESAQQAFKAQTPTANIKSGTISMYLPSAVKVEEQDANNIILSKGDKQTFIVFYNSMEDESSQLNYQSARQKENRLLLKSFKDEDRFGYVRVMPVNKQSKYELQVGQGGVKITTYSKKDELEDNAALMMNIAKSIHFKKSSYRARESY